jgi:hypothetical protein
VNGANRRQAEAEQPHHGGGEVEVPGTIVELPVQPRLIEQHRARGKRIAAMRRQHVRDVRFSIVDGRVDESIDARVEIVHDDSGIARDEGGQHRGQRGSREQTGRRRRHDCGTLPAG